MSYVVEPMQLEDISEVAAIERQSFTTPWPVYAYRREIKENRNSRYIVVRWLSGENGVEPALAPLALPEPVEQAAVTATEPVQPISQASGVREVVSRFLPFLRPASRPRPAERPRGIVVAYAGVWLIHDEAHITTIAVRPDLRGQGLGELMLVRMIELAQEMNADRITLEVRVSNQVAQNLYRKYTFTVEGVRRRYYSDDNEDALIMTSASVSSPEFREKFAENRARLYERLGNQLVRK